ncbi:hypothetical protein [Comamonas terrigena]|uniref:hypothetical protein n=1 Tax=Comamonas terrigena TaxID=32013 RepID=UPI0028A232A4|nr:hypothetical protein [Comamonas terrigena]
MKIDDFLKNFITNNSLLEGGIKECIDEHIKKLDVDLHKLEFRLFVIHRYLLESCLSQEGSVVLHSRDNDFFIEKWAKLLNIDLFNEEKDRSIFVLFINLDDIERNFRDYFFKSIIRMKNKKIIIISKAKIRIFEDWKIKDLKEHSDNEMYVYFFESKIFHEII